MDATWHVSEMMILEDNSYMFIAITLQQEKIEKLYNFIEYIAIE